MASEKEEINWGLSWATDETWREAHQTLDFLFGSYGSRMDPVREAARTAGQNLEILFPVFDRISGLVCPTCTKVCCLEARIAFDFRDILFIHALGLDIPPYQLRRSDEESCRYLGVTGCRLPRISRPFICTWYYCAPMLEHYYQFHAKEQRRLTRAMTGAQTCRKIMEECFIMIQTTDDRPYVPYLSVQASQGR